jgi:hypothetical protein
LTTRFVAAAPAPRHRLHGRPDGERSAIRDRPSTRLWKADNRHSARAQRREPSGRDPRSSDTLALVPRDRRGF